MVLLGVLLLVLEALLVGGDVFLWLFGGDVFLVLFLDLFVDAGGELFLLLFLPVISAVFLLAEVFDAVLLLDFVDGFASGLFLALFFEVALFVGDSISDRLRFFVDGGDSILIGD